MLWALDMMMTRACDFAEAHACADDARSTKILLVMEYVEGGPVVSTSGSQRRHLSEAIARKFFRDALQASSRAHTSPATARQVQAAALLCIRVLAIHNCAVLVIYVAFVVTLACTPALLL